MQHPDRAFLEVAPRAEKVDELSKKFWVEPYGQRIDSEITAVQVKFD
ncbi:MAG: hypothetical protein NTX06_00770 [Proteobacteria bacterium]|nr:hypothetical protein [Pseudomonadota bacterium]